MTHAPRRHTSAPARTLALRVAFVLVVGASLLCGIAGGLLRAGVELGAVSTGAWLSHAAVAHAFLMVSSFLGTVIGLERAVAVRRWFAFVAPVASGASGLLMLSGEPLAAAWLAAVAAATFVAVNAVVVARQPAAHTAVLLVGAATWLVGALVHALDARADAAVSWWLAFLVLTIAAERLEMTRLMRRRSGTAEALVAILALLLVACAVSAFADWGRLLYGCALLALAAWLAHFDIARRTVKTSGLSRYMAVCLLLGYAWLGVAGVAWVASAAGLPARDAALHALAVGFVFSMIFGHAPVILPAVARVKLAYSASFYLPLAVLHVSLAVRLLAPFEPSFLRLGAAGNAAAIALFIANVAVSAFAWRLRHASQRHPHAHPSHP